MSLLTTDDLHNFVCFKTNKRDFSPSTDSSNSSKKKSKKESRRKQRMHLRRTKKKRRRRKRKRLFMNKNQNHPILLKKLSRNLLLHNRQLRRYSIQRDSKGMVRELSYSKGKQLNIFSPSLKLNSNLLHPRNS